MCWCRWFRTLVDVLRGTARPRGARCISWSGGRCGEAARCGKRTDSASPISIARSADGKNPARLLGAGGYGLWPDRFRILWSHFAALIWHGCTPIPIPWVWLVGFPGSRLLSSVDFSLPTNSGNGEKTDSNGLVSRRPRRSVKHIFLRDVSISSLSHAPWAKIKRQNTSMRSVTGLDISQAPKTVVNMISFKHIRSALCILPNLHDAPNVFLAMFVFLEISQYAYLMCLSFRIMVTRLRLTIGVARRFYLLGEGGPESVRMVSIGDMNRMSSGAVSA